MNPARLQTSELADLTFSVPNEGDAPGIDRVTFGIPANFDLDDAEAKPGWTQSDSGNAVTWSGGRIPKGEYATFSIRGIAPAKAQTVHFSVLVGDRTGKTITYDAPIAVVAHGPQDSGARTLGTAALIAALIGAALALAALFLGLYLWLRPPPP
ncbi:MAG: hypothetical protein ACJ76I_16245 [Gaiellaceae bacterium]